jgi:DNA-binding NtrC family response regulator
VSTGVDFSTASNLAVVLGSLPELTGTSPVICAARRSAEVATLSSEAVLISGETGTGKSQVARMIHHLSFHTRAPFLTVLCPALQREPTDFSALVVRARGGAILLDEVDEMPSDDQSAMAAALAREGGPLGAVRLFATTKLDVEELSRDGTLHAALRAISQGVRIELPPLRERRSDVSEVAQALLARTLGESAADTQSWLTASALGALAAHDWPGNVLELENVLRRARVLVGEGAISGSDIVAALSTSQSRRVARP